MMDDSLFLTPDQVIEAICRDFRQYEPQIVLFCEILRVLLGEPATVKMAPHGQGVWVSGSGGKLRRVSEAELSAHVCDTLKAADSDVEVLAALCRRVFQTTARVEKDPCGEQTGVRIETGMRAFACKQCGHCCRNLDYNGKVAAEDVARWEAAGRRDILKWVSVSRQKSGQSAYLMWVTPGTNQYAKPCPFLRRGSSPDRWICAIHDVKPAVCRQYPITRKHALKTGCRGFEKP